MATDRIKDCFDRLRAEKKKAFVAYLTAGDPCLETTPSLVWALERAGADLIELGVPFSDPVADGLVIQMAFQRALDAGTHLVGVLDAVRKIRLKSEIPLILFTYYNPVMKYGFDKFASDAAAAGADGMLLLDLPPEEGAEEKKCCEAHGMKWICLIAPTTPENRLESIAKASSGFVYYVSREGVTGMREQTASSAESRVALIQKHTDIPVCVGFGVSNAEHVRSLTKTADGVVVGSAIVKQIELSAGQPETALLQKVELFVKPMAAAAHEPVEARELK